MGARSRCRPATAGDGVRPIGALHLTGHFLAIGACAIWATSQVVLAGKPLTFLTLVPRADGGHNARGWGSLPSSEGAAYGSDPWDHAFRLYKVSKPTHSKSLKAIGLRATRQAGCTSDRLVVGRSVVDLGVVGVAASGTHGGAVVRHQPRHRGARAASARLIGRRIQRRRCRVVPVAAWGRQSQEPMTYANIPLEPTRPASDPCVGLTAQRPR